MDLSKAFDTIDHEILITKMDHYGIKNLESQWFKSYLSDRKQYVEFNNTGVARPRERLINDSPGTV